MKVNLIVEAICPNCSKTNRISKTYFSIYQHEWDEFDSVTRCEGTLKCEFCGYKEDFTTDIY